MGYSIQNEETGEVDYLHYSESTKIVEMQFDEETGEPMSGKLRVRYKKLKSFKIPKSCLRGTQCEEFEKYMLSGEYGDTPTCTQVTSTSKEEEPPKPKLYEREDYMKMDCVKNDIILGYNKDNYRLFLIPTLFLFNMYVALFFALFETLLHFWAHKKNGLNMNKEIYYRSPLHVLTSQFCATCRSESEMDLQIFDMLNKHMRIARESRTLKDVTKALT